VEVGDRLLCTKRLETEVARKTLQKVSRCGEMTDRFPHVQLTDNGDEVWLHQPSVELDLNAPDAAFQLHRCGDLDVRESLAF
jgi:hypothetical protein